MVCGRQVSSKCQLGEEKYQKNSRSKFLDGVVRASVSGAFSLDNAKTFFLEILGRAREEGINKILIDARGITTEISTMARFEFGSHLAAQRPQQIKPERQRENQGFA